ncbi:MAG: hypothetical protein KJ587_14835 [Alphaproteobacteria bacterium]|nr:hypothetical protein [Alphaproteobacteria bacterium]
MPRLLGAADRDRDRPPVSAAYAVAFFSRPLVEAIDDDLVAFTRQFATRSLRLTRAEHGQPIAIANPRIESAVFPSDLLIVRADLRLL